MSDNELQTYAVSLQELSEGNEFLAPINFIAEAEDMDHAEEQALNAYPGCHVVSVKLA